MKGKSGSASKKKDEIKSEGGAPKKKKKLKLGKGSSGSADDTESIRVDIERAIEVCFVLVCLVPFVFLFPFVPALPCGWLGQGVHQHT
jgi:hypothetical protein